MFILIISVVLLVFAGVLAMFWPRAANALGSWGAIIACVLGLVPATAALLGVDFPLIEWSWTLPGGAFALGLDRLSGFFVFLVLFFSMLVALYGQEYLVSYTRQRRSAWFFLNLLIASMVVLIAARNAILFLVGWELMALASFCLVLTDSDNEAARRAGWIYLVATHLGTFFVFALFILLARTHGSFSFSELSADGVSPSLVFLFALIGFGTKAGIMPLHVWSPEAYPAAPSHVSALMSSVMSKTGIYGLLRVLMILGAPSPWWGTVLLVIGFLTGIVAVLFALMQKDLKRLLAYSSIEHIGIIFIGLGLGVMGQALHVPALAVLGYAGAVFHCFNHAIFKSLLFFGAGSLIRATGTRDLDILGGLIKRLPVLAAVFTVGAAAISGLPPFMGFASEFLLYLGLFHGGVLARTTDTFAPCVFGLVSLAMIGAASIACYTRLIGFVFLGEPRSDHALHVSGHRPGWRMLWPMMILASLCLLLGVFSPVILRAVEPLVAELSSGATAAFSLSAVPLVWVSIVGLVVLCVVGGLLLFRRKLLSGREVPCDRLTWDCGYHGPTARMQYTASSFGRPIGVFFRVLNPDIFERRLFIPLFAGAARLLLKMRRFQQGRLQLYLLYIFITLVVLLIWQAGGV